MRWKPRRTNPKFGIKHTLHLYTTTMKASFKNVAFFLVILSLLIVVFAAVDSALSINVDTNDDTYLRVTVVDLQGNPVHNAQIYVCDGSFFTDNKGLSPNILLTDLANVYDCSVTQWHTINVVVKKEGFVPTVVLNCVVYHGQTRRLTIKIYPNDNSGLPYVCYVESPPHEYVKEMVGN